MIIELPKNINGTDTEHLQEQITSMKEQLNNYYSNTQNTVVGDLEVKGTIKMGKQARISWANIDGTEDVATQESVQATLDAIEEVEGRIPTNYVPYTTDIDGNHVITQYLIANNLDIKGGSVNVNSYSENGLSVISLHNTYGNKTVSTNMATKGFSVEDSTGAGTWIDDTGITTDKKIFTNGFDCQGTATFDSNVTVYGTLSNSDGGRYVTVADIPSFSNYYKSGDTMYGQFQLSHVYTTSNATAAISTGNQLYQLSGSSRRFKHDIHSMDSEFKKSIRKLYDLEVKQWTYNDDYIDPEDELANTETFGLIAEEVEEVLPGAVTHDKDGNVTNYRDRHLINAMLVLIQEQNERIKALEAKLDMQEEPAE